MACCARNPLHAKSSKPLNISSSVKSATVSVGKVPDLGPPQTTRQQYLAKCCDERQAYDHNLWKLPAGVAKQSQRKDKVDDSEDPGQEYHLVKQGRVYTWHTILKVKRAHAYTYIYIYMDLYIYMYVNNL